MASFGAACATPPAVFPELRPPRLQAPRPPGLDAALEQRGRRLRSLRGLATMRYSSAEERVQFREVVVVRRPDRLRLEMISTFGVVLQITSDGERLRAFHRAEKTFYEGAATTGNLSRFTRLALEIEAITDVFLGLPPRRRAVATREAAWEAETRLWRLSRSLAGGGVQVVWLEPENLRPVRTEEVDALGQRLYAIAFRDAREIDGFDLPFEIEVELTSEQATITLTYSEVSVNPELEDSLFTFEAPAGARVVPLDEAS